MGISVAASIQNTGHKVYWASEGRSQETDARAREHHLHDIGSLARMCETCSVIVCVCPPHAAEEVAGEVLSHNFNGLYLDANAISPQRAVRIGHEMEKAGVSFVDGGIIGGPAWEPGRTWLYLSGEKAQTAASYFSAGPLETEIIGEAVGKASALKMCYAAYTKGTRALLCAILATAETLGVREELKHPWSGMGPEFTEKAVEGARRVTARAWRFAGEMEEIAETFEGAGVPGGFHRAASVIYRRMAQFKEAPSTPELEEVLSALVGDERQG